MFTGIVQGTFQVSSVMKKPGLLQYSIRFPEEMMNGLEKGASVSVNGVCQTVVKMEGDEVWFDAIQETLSRTNLDELESGTWVNVERSARWGDEVGGHLLSGHVYGVARVEKIERPAGNCIFTFRCAPEWMKYFFSKGFIALNGVSLTLVDVDPSGTFTVHLIPETLSMTTFGHHKPGDRLNVEFDSQTQAIVETVERLLKQKKLI